MRALEIEPGVVVDVDQNTVRDADDPDYIRVDIDAGDSGLKATLTILRSLWNAQ